MISGVFLFMLKALIVYYFIKMILEILLVGIWALIFILNLLLKLKKEEKKNV
jgi:hypothetical protein